MQRGRGGGGVERWSGLFMGLSEHYDVILSENCKLVGRRERERGMCLTEGGT